MMRKMRALLGGAAKKLKKSGIEEPLFKIQRRRQVLPGVWLGTSGDFTNEEFFKSENIKFVENISSSTWFPARPQEKGMERKDLTVRNVAFYKLDPTLDLPIDDKEKEKKEDDNKKEKEKEKRMSDLPGIWKAIEYQKLVSENYVLTKNQMGALLLCSLSGQDNGPIFVFCLYLIYTYGWSAQQCLQFVTQQCSVDILVDKSRIADHRAYILLVEYAKEVREWIQSTQASAQKIAETNNIVSLSPPKTGGNDPAPMLAQSSSSLSSTNPPPMASASS
jgi:hypothetical protein